MIDHTGIGVADVGRSATFYDAALKALGMHLSMQMPEDVGSDGIGYGFDYPVFWIDRFHPTQSNSIPPSWPIQGPRSMHSMKLHSKRAAPIMARPASAGRITMPHSCSTQMATIWRRSSVETEARGPQAR
jgi:hypothetical protein